MSETTSGTSGRAAMRPFGELAPFDRVRELIEELGRPVGEARRLPLRESAGRVLAEQVVAPEDVPRGDRAAMDGYAVRAAETEAATPDRPVALRRVARILAGEETRAEVGAGECVEIATGAPMPPGADAVVPVEETRSEDDTVEVLGTVEPGRNVSARGEDLREGEVVARLDARLTPPSLGAIASLGVDRIEVYRRPRVLVVPTGDELVALGDPLPTGHVYDSNSVALTGLLESSGTLVEPHAVIGDDPKGLQAALERDGFDLIVTLGGTSVGRHDLVLDVVDRLGDILVHGVAVKPGKPLLIAVVNGRPVIGLPGFPTSSLMLAYAVVAPLVRRMARLPEGVHRLQGRLSVAAASPADRHQFLTVTVDGGAVTPAYKESSTITSMSHADGWIEIPAGVDRLAAGSEVEVKTF